MKPLSLLFLVLAGITIVLAASLMTISSDDLNDESSTTPELQKISFRQGFITGPDWIPYVVAQEKGFYEEEGFDVTLGTGKGTPSTIKLVDAKKDDFGVVFASGAVIAKSVGSKVKSVAAFQQENSFRVYYNIDSGINFPNELKGKKIASSQGTANNIEFPVFAKAVGLDDKKVDWVHSQSYLQLLEIFKKGEVDALMGRDFVHGFQLDNANYKGYRVFDPARYGVKMYGQQLIVHEDTIRENPEMVGKFTRASLKGWEYAMENPEEAVKIYVERFPQFEAEKELKKWKILFKPVINHEYSVGHQNPEIWETMNEDFFELGIIENKIDIDDIYTDQFLP